MLCMLLPVCFVKDILLCTLISCVFSVKCEVYSANCSPVCFSETYYALQTGLLCVFLRDYMLCMMLSCVFF